MILFIDCETVCGVSPAEPEPGIEYADGWQDYLGMGIACACALDDRGLPLIALGENLGPQSEWRSQLAAAQLIVGFNLEFDANLLAAHGAPLPPDVPRYDLQRAVWRGMGLSEKYDPATHGGTSLGALAEENLGIGKSGHGGDAPVRWQRGERGPVIGYCLRDCWLLRKLTRRVVITGGLLLRGEYVRVTYPASLAALMD